MCIPPQTPDTPTHSGISEAVLAAIWNEQSYLRGPMWCCDGQPVAVVYRGRWTAGSGPDFEAAILSLGEGGSRLVTGSVEMHLQCGDWWAHGHDRDPRYNSVALHVVLRPNGARPVTRADGVSVPTLVLADYITLPTSELLERVIPLVGGVGTLSEEPCWKRTENWPTNRLLEPIETAGDARLRAKATTFEADLHVLNSPDDVFYAGLMDALGYSANREPMRALASALPIFQLLLLPLGKDLADRVRILESVLLGGAGLLPSQRPGLGEMDWESGAVCGGDRGSMEHPCTPPHRSARRRVRPGVEHRARAARQLPHAQACRSRAHTRSAPMGRGRYARPLPPRQGRHPRRSGQNLDPPPHRAGRRLLGARIPTSGAGWAMAPGARKRSPS